MGDLARRFARQEQRAEGGADHLAAPAAQYLAGDRGTDRAESVDDDAGAAVHGQGSARVSVIAGAGGPPSWW